MTGKHEAGVMDKMTDIFSRQIEPRCDKSTGCWIFTGSLHWRGYGQVSRNHHVLRTHRVSYIARRGEIPNGMQVQHACDVRACCNPDHLKLGTPADNTDDMMRRNRHVPVRGDDRPDAMLTSEQVVEIKRSLGVVSQRQLARNFGVHKNTINGIARGITWKHVEV